MSKEKDKAVTFVYRPQNYTGPIALDATPSKECKEYHENSGVQINLSKDFKIDSQEII